MSWKIVEKASASMCACVCACVGVSLWDGEQSERFQSCYFIQRKKKHFNPKDFFFKKEEEEKNKKFENEILSEIKTTWIKFEVFYTYCIKRVRDREIE